MRMRESRQGSPDSTPTLFFVASVVEPSMSLALPLLAVSAVPDRDQVRVLVAGELDLATVGEVRDQIAALLDAGWRDVLIDLRELTFMDTSGVHALLDADQRARAEGVRLAVVVGSGPVRELLRITATDQILTLAPGADTVA
jgi:anti-sigma B factor antagonist